MAVSPFPELEVFLQRRTEADSQKSPFRQKFPVTVDTQERPTQEENGIKIGTEKSSEGTPQRCYT